MRKGTNTTSRGATLSCVHGDYASQLYVFQCFGMGKENGTHIYTFWSRRFKGQIISFKISSMKTFDKFTLIYSS